MNKKLLKQILNEWKSNTWLFIELLLVSVIMWFAVDFFYVQITRYLGDNGFNVDNCYHIVLGKINKKSPNYQPNDTTYISDIKEIVTRLKRRQDVEAVSLSYSSYPYDTSNSGSYISYKDGKKEMHSDVNVRRITPGFINVFKIKGVNGESPEIIASKLEKNKFLATDNLFNEYNKRLTAYIGKSMMIDNDSTNCDILAASLQNIRYSDFQDYSPIIFTYLSESDYSFDMELCVRAKAQYNNTFKKDLLADSENHFRVGNLFINNIESFNYIKTNYLSRMTIMIRDFIVGMGFLLINIFLGLFGTFWFRTQRRKGEIALHMVVGSNKREIFIRLISEALIILIMSTIIAMVIDFNIAYANLNFDLYGNHLSVSRFIITILTTFIMISVMIILGIWYPALKAMRLHPAEALQEE